ncbi:MAG: hypothetical protein KF773_03690 [Deltaproteobacteria bacterium]|nr:hypothetical protein [Deltaproteobacteria bacterium]
MRFLLLVVLVGCGSAAPSSTGPARVAPSVSAKPDVRGSREAMVREVVARIAAGDVDGLVAFADGKEALARAVECTGSDGDELRKRSAKEERRLHERMTKLAAASKGLAIEVVSLRERTEAALKAGEKDGDCTVKTDVTHERVKVSLRVGGKPAEMKLELLDLGGRYYVIEVPRRIKVDGDGDGEVITRFMTHVDQVCACADDACIVKVTEDFGREMAEWAKEHAGETATTPSEEDRRRVEEATARMTACTAKITPP